MIIEKFKHHSCCVVGALSGCRGLYHSLILVCRYNLILNYNLRLQTNRARLAELERQNVSVEELVKTHKQKLAEKNLRINKLETDLLRGTDPLEDK